MAGRRHFAALAVASLLLSGCSIMTPAPLWELVKATGEAATRGIQSAPGEASNTVYHGVAPFSRLCIEYNPKAQSADVVPALQLALRAHQIDSRVYESAISAPNCPIWLRYSTQVQWDKAPLSDRFEAYIHQAALTLQDDRGQVLSSSYYTFGDAYKTSKWATTQSKLASVVSALLTGATPMQPTTHAFKESS
jgi:hypothetical protein